MSRLFSSLTDARLITLAEHVTLLRFKIYRRRICGFVDFTENCILKSNSNCLISVAASAVADVWEW